MYLKNIVASIQSTRGYHTELIDGGYTTETGYGFSIQPGTLMKIIGVNGSSYKPGGVTWISQSNGSSSYMFSKYSFDIQCWIRIVDENGNAAAQ